MVLLAELKENSLTAIAYSSPSENNIFYNKNISNSLCKQIIDTSKSQFIDDLQRSDKNETLEAQAGLKCLYGVPVLDEQGNNFACLCMYSKKQSYISDEKKRQLEIIKIQLEEDIIYASKHYQRNTIPRDVLLNEDEKLKYFFRYSPIGIFYFDKNLIITDLNEKFAHILKSDKRALLGLNINKIYDKRVLPALQNALLGIEDEYEGEYLTSTSGNVTNVLLKAAPVFVNKKIAGGIGILQDISIRTKIEKALKSSENKYRDLVEKINDVIFSIDANGICTYISPVIKLLVGYDPQEVIGYSFSDFVCENHRLTFSDALKSVKRGCTVDSEIKIKNKSGDFNWIRSSMRPIYGEDGVFVGIHGIAQDIRETKRIELSLRESEEQFRMVATHISDIIYEWNPHTDELTWYGDPSVILKQLSTINKFSDLKEFIHEEDRPTITQRWENALKDGIAWKNEFKLQSGNHKPIYILGSGLMLFKNDKPHKGFGTLTNVSTEKELVENLKLSNQRLAKNMTKTNSLMSAIPDMMFVFDRNGKITDYQSNDEAELFKKANIFIHKNVNQVLPPDIAQLTLDKIAIVLHNKNIETYKYELQFKNTVQIFESRMVYLDEEHTLAIVRNITTKELAEKELITAKEKAEESDRLKSSFLANMSHEIRTPMNGIIGFSELLSSKTINPAEREYYTSVIIKSGHQLLDIINDVLEISKIETGQIQVNNSVVHVFDVLQTMFSFFNKKALENDIHLRVDIPEDEEKVLVVTDESKLKQILSNLISNAVKFTKGGTICIGYSITDRFIEFFVEDNGIGIAKQEQKKIFERFSQANPQIMRQHGGTGLGLSISQSLVEILGGSIGLDSVPGKGSKFSFTIPYKQPK
ncbi:PAS domain S-box protein [Saccharicrinis fermentans]|uniref:histidine kinase n=1 Tax=Saccharicrinis fermentans DSM 9555 = JCM 21142 TaxID=869213 RepID=W7Y9V8_9BACT|nr:PAS domain S-box protein [Saccharicrinis fermentans]GAF04313.1 signal transduction histidine-protein kinase BarA [Saccharicrinis fermentans DSM 9555 = JCM 21142]